MLEHKGRFYGSNTKLQRKKLKIADDKTQIVVLNSGYEDNYLDILHNDTPVQSIQNLKYLGVTTRETGITRSSLRKW